MFWAEIWKISEFFIWKFSCFVVQFSVYLNRHVFIMCFSCWLCTAVHFINLVEASKIKLGNVMQPIYFPLIIYRFWNQTRLYSRYPFIPEQGWSIFSRCHCMQTIWINNPAVVEYKWYLSLPELWKAVRLMFFENQVVYLDCLLA